MLGDLVASADPDPVVAQDVIDETGKRGGASRLADETTMQSDGHDLRRLLALAMERVEIVAQRDEEILGLTSAQASARRVSLSSSVCGHRTLRWRKADSNRWSHLRRRRFSEHGFDPPG
jgi:hypothetical protein